MLRDQVYSVLPFILFLHLSNKANELLIITTIHSPQCSDIVRAFFVGF